MNAAIMEFKRAASCSQKMINCEGWTNLTAYNTSIVNWNLIRVLKFLGKYLEYKKRLNFCFF